MTAKQKLKTVIVDDSKEFRTALRLFCELFDELEISHEYNDGTEFINSLDKHVPSLVFMDVEMPHLNGIEATKKALALHPEITIVGLSFQNQHHYIDKMRTAGATDYITKSNISHSKIQQIINTLSNGNK